MINNIKDLQKALDNERVIYNINNDDIVIKNSAVNRNAECLKNINKFSINAEVINDKIIFYRR